MNKTAPPEAKLPMTATNTQVGVAIAMPEKQEFSQKKPVPAGPDNIQKAVALVVPAKLELGSPPSAPPKRTPGLLIFDAFLYPFLTNFAVFGISVAATYLTNKGGMRNAQGKLLHGELGKWFNQRGESVIKIFKKMGMTHEQADMSKMVFFSFADGTAVAPMVKLLEDRRENISKWVDDRLGTTPADEIAAYKAEPKQSWFSVIGGRLAVASIIVPTAVLLDKTGMNNVMFSGPGKRFGTWVASKPHLAKYFGKLDIPELGRVGAFEFFYTSVCTAGLYVTSRFIARKTSKKKTGEMESILDGNEKDFAKKPTASPMATEDTVETEKRFTDIHKPQARTIVKSGENFAQKISNAPESSLSMTAG